MTNNKPTQLIKYMLGIDCYATMRQAGASIQTSLGLTFGARYLPLIAEIAAGVQAYNGHYLQAGFTLACAESLRIPVSMGERELRKTLDTKLLEKELDGEK